MYDYFIPQATEKEIAKERAKARELRKSKWWHEKISHGESCAEKALNSTGYSFLD